MRHTIPIPRSNFAKWQMQLYQNLKVIFFPFVINYFLSTCLQCSRVFVKNLLQGINHTRFDGRHLLNEYWFLHGGTSTAKMCLLMQDCWVNSDMPWCQQVSWRWALAALNAPFQNRIPLHTIINTQNPPTYLCSPFKGLLHIDLVKQLFNYALIPPLCPTELLWDLNLLLYLGE